MPTYSSAGDDTRAGIPEVASNGSAFAVGDIVMIATLLSRPELSNTRCRILAFEDGRFRVTLEETMEIARMVTMVTMSMTQEYSWKWKKRMTWLLPDDCCDCHVVPARRPLIWCYVVL